MVLPPPEPNKEEKLEELPGDIHTPFSPPDDTTPADLGVSDDDQQADDTSQTTAIDPTHPQTDTEIEEEEWYDEGLSGAAEAQEPNAGNNVIGYRKPGGTGSEERKGGEHGNDKAA